MEFIDFLKKEGNSVISSNPATALELYSKCIEVDDIFRVLVDRERAIIHSNRSQACMKLGDLGGAFHDAIDCVKIDPSYVKVSILFSIICKIFISSLHILRQFVWYFGHFDVYYFMSFPKIVY